MKRTALFSLVLFITAIFYSSCKEDVYMDWKNINDRYYSTLVDTVAKYDTMQFTYVVDSTTMRDTTRTFPFKKTSTGIYYQVIYQGYDRYPNVQDRIKVRYKGWLADRYMFDSVATSTYAILYLSSCVPGWQEIVPKMQNGGHYIFYLPSPMGYDTVTTNSTIPPYSVLKFDLQLLDSY